MTRSEEYYTILDLKVPRPANVLALLSQMSLRVDDLEQHDGILRIRSAEKIRRKIRGLLELQRDERPKLLAFPELSIPREALSDLSQYSQENHAVVIAGTHYHTEDGRNYSRCPVYICGEEYFIEKYAPSPLQTSYIESERIAEGRRGYVFRGTPAGSFAVMICSDFLRSELIDFLKGNDLDFLVVPSCQEESSRYVDLMANFVRESVNGIYVLFPNLIIGDKRDTKSACVAVVDDVHTTSAVGRGLTDLQPRQKVWESSTPNDYLLARFDLTHKKPSLSKSSLSEPNVSIIRTRTLDSAKRISAGGRRYQLVALDLDGTLLRGARFSWVKVWESIGDADGRRWRALMLKYRRNEISYREWGEIALGEFRASGVGLEQMKVLARELQITRNFREGMAALRAAGFVVGIVSGGIDVFLYELIPDWEDIFDFVHINRLHFHADGDIAGMEATRYDFDGKLRAVELECEERDMTLLEAVFVGDQFNDEVALKGVGHAVLYTSIVDGTEFSAHHAIREDDFLVLAEYIVGLNRKPIQNELFSL